MMNAAIDKAKAILAGVATRDSSIGARGRRAHARAIATIEAAERLAGIEKQLHIANLIASVPLGGAESVRAREKVKEMLWPVGGDVAEQKQRSENSVLGGNPVTRETMSDKDLYITGEIGLDELLLRVKQQYNAA